MDIVVWSASPGGHLPRLLSALKPVLNGTDFKLLGGLDALSRYLRYSLTGQSLTVLLAETRQDLEGLASVGQLIYGTKVLLIIPDGESRNVVLGHALRPRYLSYVDSDFADVAAVLEQMVKWAESQDVHGIGPHGYGSGHTG